MKHYLKPIWSLVVASTLLFGGHSAMADTSSDTETVLNWAENAYPDLFPSPQGTQFAAPYLYRFYPETEIYAGVNTSDLGVYVLGGVWSEPTYVDSLASLVSSIQGSGSDSSIAACDTTDIPEGISYSQSGNVVTVTTNGNCIAIPENTNFCEVPEDRATETGISVLSTTSVTESSYSGITINFPGDLPFNPLDSLVSSTKICTINAPVEFENTIINSDVCVDITNQLGDLGGIADTGLVTVNPPVTFATKTTSTNQVVADCFATDATTIVNAVTDETWINQNGTFVQL